MSKFEHLSVLLDCSRNAVMNVTSVKKMIDYLSKLGYNSLQLYTEDTFEITNEKYFGYMRGRYTQQEIKEIDAYAITKGIELIPCVQTLAHLNQMFRWNAFSDIKDFSEILLIDEPKTYEFIENMLINVKQCFTSRNINICMDEANMVGLGKYLKLHGYVDRFDLLLRHLKRVNELLIKHNFKAMMWSDMFFTLLNDGNYYASETKFNSEKIDLIPEKIDMIYWDYYNLEKKHYDDMITNHKSFKNNLWFAGGAWSWVGFTPHNEFSIRHFNCALDSCVENNVKNIMVTLWGDDGKECSYFALLPTLNYVSCYNNGIVDEKQIKKQFYHLTKVELQDFMALDLADRSRGQVDVSNPSKYMLYNDCFMGLFDCGVIGGEGLTYEKYAKQLKKLFNKYRENSEFTYLFSLYYNLCKVLSYKYELGVNTRKVYYSGNKEKMKKIILEYKNTIKYLKVFYKEFCNTWLLENKSFGLEVQDIRLGGLIARLERCKNTLCDYVEGKIAVIEELEQETLDFQCNNPSKHNLLNYNLWVNNVSANRL